MQSTPAPDSSQVLSQDEARALTARVLSFSTADQTRVTVDSERSGNTRFADGSITTSGGTDRHLRDRHGHRSADDAHRRRRTCSTMRR